jgi:glycosyltransferase involved in cell wall biosynthesis
MKKEAQNNKILFLIQLPPPIHGVSVINEHIYNLKVLDQFFEKDFIELKFSNNLKTLSRLSFDKIYRTFKISFSLFKKSILFKPNFIYFTISPANSTFYRDLIFVFIFKIMRIMPIYHLHAKGITDNINKHSLLIKVYRWVFNNSIIIHLSDGLIASEITPLKLKKTTVYKLQNGIKKQDSSVLIPIEDKQDDLLFLSNLFPSKGIFVFIEALSFVKQELPKIKVNIVGNTVNEIILENVNRMIDDYDLTENVFVHGQKTGGEKNSFFEKSKIFVHPTLNDAFPLVILEALQHGLPVISTFEGAIPEIINKNIGALVEKSQPKLLADEIVKMLKNNVELKNMSENCNKKFNEKYSIDKFDDNIETIFKAIIR